MMLIICWIPHKKNVSLTKKTFHYIPLQKIYAAWTFCCGGENFFDFFGYFFCKAVGRFVKGPIGMDDNWLAMEARLQLRTKNHTWVDLSTGLLPFLIILKDIKVYSLFWLQYIKDQYAAD